MSIPMKVAQQQQLHCCRCGEQEEVAKVQCSSKDESSSLRSQQELSHHRMIRHHSQAVEHGVAGRRWQQEHLRATAGWSGLHCLKHSLAAGVHCEQREEQQLKHDVDVMVGHVMELVAVNAARLRDGGSSCFVLFVCAR
jgi:hypothetical protein